MCEQVRAEMSPHLGLLMDGQGTGVTANYTAMAQHSGGGLIMDMNTYVDLQVLLSINLACSSCL